MRTARECLLQAERCDYLAMACVDPVNRDMLFETGQYWRQLAKNAELNERRGSEPPSKS